MWPAGTVAHPCFKLSKCLKLTYFDMKRLPNLKKVENISKLRPTDTFSVFECHFAARKWVWVWHDCSKNINIMLNTLIVGLFAVFCTKFFFFSNFATLFGHLATLNLKTTELSNCLKAYIHFQTKFFASQSTEIIV